MPWVVCIYFVEFRDIATVRIEPCWQQGNIGSRNGLAPKYDNPLLATIKTKFDDTGNSHSPNIRHKIIVKIYDIELPCTR